MSATASKPGAERDALKRAAAKAAVELVQDGMVVGLGTGSTSAFPPPSARQRWPRPQTFRSPHSPSIGRSILRSTAQTKWNAARLT
jgi:hypothetical protein